MMIVWEPWWRFVRRAERFAAALRRDTRQRVVAVGSRTTASATEFATRIGGSRGHGSYADLVTDPEVDVVYG